jgi:hypothetical protein
LKDYSANFGLAIAFVAPGVVGLWGLSFFYPTVRSWFGASPGASPTAPAFLFVLLASTSMGLVISGLRQELLDWLFKVTKWAVRPATDDSKLVDPNTLEALRFVADALYRYAQFYGNMAVALVFAYACWLAKRGFWNRGRRIPRGSDLGTEHSLLPEQVLQGARGSHRNRAEGGMK